MVEHVMDGIIICRCHGRVTDGVDIDDIADFIRRMSPGMQVIISDDLCQPQVLKRVAVGEGLRPVAIGACSELRVGMRFWEDEDKCSISPFVSRVLPLMEEADAGFTVEEATQRVKLLLWAQVRRSSSLTQVTPQNLKVCVQRPVGKIGRREFTAMLLPQYMVVPSIDTSLCSGGLKCSLCRDLCPLGAIKVEDDKVEIVNDICSGCGACISVCPRMAISYPTFSLHELDGELQGLLMCRAIRIEPRIIALVDGSSDYVLYSDEKSRLPFNVFPMKLPSIYMASPLLMLRAFEMGVQGLVIIHSEPEQKGRSGEKLWRGHIKFAQDLLDLWGVGGHRIKLLDTRTDGSDDIQIRLERFASDMAGLTSTPFTSGGCVSSGIDGLKLSDLIRRMECRLPQSSQGMLSGEEVPFGMIKLDSSKCTGCGLCAASCPTDAIEVITDVSDCGSYSISFKHDLCVGCGVCVNICPERCMEMEKVLALNEFGDSSVVLFEDSFVKCHRCGNYFAPRSMMERLKARLQETGNGHERWTEFCPECRLSAQLKGRG